MSLRKKALSAALAGALLCAPLAGCEKKPESVQTTIFAMDTVMNLTLYGDEAKPTMEQAVETIYTLESQLSVTREGSALFALNRGNGAVVTPPQKVGELLREALALCEATGGALDITAYPAVKAWGFTTGEYRVPGQEELDALAGSIDYTAVDVDETTGQITLPEGVEIDLGAVAKGYTGDQLAILLGRAGVDHALLDLGQSSIQTIGAKPDGSLWRVGVQDPMGDSYLGVLEIADLAVGTSGGYQRYFEENGVCYWHIIDPDTAAPARSGLACVTVVSPSGLVCDGLSTALFVMGLEEGFRFWQNNPGLSFEAIFITGDGGIFITPGLVDSFTLAEGYGDREVTVLS